MAQKLGSIENNLRFCCFNSHVSRCGLAGYCPSMWKQWERSQFLFRYSHHPKLFANLLSRTTGRKDPPISRTLKNSGTTQTAFISCGIGNMPSIWWFTALFDNGYEWVYRVKSAILWGRLSMWIKKTDKFWLYPIYLLFFLYYPLRIVRLIKT